MTAAAVLQGGGLLGVRSVEGASAVIAARASDPLKLLVSTPRGPCTWAFTTTYGGGLLAGDRVALDLDVGPGARLFLGTQASTKIYRSPNGVPTTQALRVRVGSGALLVNLPDPTTPFATAVHLQTQDLDLEPTADLIWLDGVTAGRVARGEVWAFTRHRSRVRVRVGGVLRAVDALDLSAADGPVALRLGPYLALSTLIIGGPGMSGRAASALERALSGGPIEGPATAPALLRTAAALGDWGVLIRLAATSRQIIDAEVRALLGDLRPLIHDDPWERRP